jgi:von Willebrand factor type A domain
MIRSRAILVVSVSMVTAGACVRPPLSTIDGAGGSGAGGRQPCATFEARSRNKLPPDVLILLDASGSMNNTTDDLSCGGGCGAASKWAQLTPALDALVAANESTVDWGLKMFADTDATCGVSSAIAVPVAKMNASPIAAAIGARTSGNGDLLNGSRTPTRAAVTAAAGYLAALDDGNPKLILLLTDGAPNCPAAGADSATDDSVATVQAVADARASGVPTLVVGIATAGGSAERALNDMAVAGGRPRTGATPAYYPVSNIADLKNTLTPLIATPADCVLALPPAPTGAAWPPIGLRANGAEIPFDAGHRDGWDWTDTSRTSVQLYGAVCDDFIAGRIDTVTIELYCPGD